MFLLELHPTHFFKPNMQEALMLQKKLNNDASLYQKKRKTPSFRAEI